MRNVEQRRKITPLLPRRQCKLLAIQLRYLTRLLPATPLTSKIEEVKVDISLICQDFHRLQEQVSESERRISHVEDEIQHQLHSLIQKQDDMENRFCRCNLRFVGLPEGVEG